MAANDMFTYGDTETEGNLAWRETLVRKIQLWKIWDGHYLFYTIMLMSFRLTWRTTLSGVDSTDNIRLILNNFDRLFRSMNYEERREMCRHNGRIWDRSYEGDINITDHSELVYKLYARKQGSYFVNKVYPNLDIDFLDASVIDKAKKMAVSRNKNHVWENMSNEELLRSTNLILTDPETKREEITLAAILLFGKDNSIMSVLPKHKTDAIFRVENKDR